MNLDLQIFNAINGYAKKSRFLDFLGIFFAKYAGYLLILWLLVFSYIHHNIKFFLAPMAAGAISLIVVNEAIYMFYKRKRPIEVIPENALIEKPISPAFPSSHTSFFFALSLTLFLINVHLAVIFLIISCLISLSRIFCGVHWPSDILGGIFSACISLVIIFIIKAVL